MTVTPKELWAIAPKLRMALKEILTGCWASVEGKELSREQAKQAAEINIVEIDSL